MGLIHGFNVLVLFLVLGAQVWYRRSFRFSRLAFVQKFGELVFKRGLRLLWILSALFILGVFIRDAFWQYQIWLSGPMKYALPPYQSPAYFLSYVGTRFLSPWFLSFFFSYLVSRLARKLNRRFENRFFEDEEIDLIALGVFLSGYPGFLFYIISIFFFGSLVSSVYSLLSKGRLSLYYFWIPLAIFAIILVNWLVPRLGFQNLLSQLILGDFVGLIFGPIGI